ncbi:Extracellular membrane CFEM domain [Cordyceps militaris]|uniref:Extracellular membrane CFEM domain n=1 Tax=Cordyceps militaris TaxID=73501 RepID=A0A2H4SRQ6_CORMI|nr:Extracellular membrane CFEM domain [Cordyceps militaris]
MKYISLGVLAFATSQAIPVAVYTEDSDSPVSITRTILEANSTNSYLSGYVPVIRPPHDGSNVTTAVKRYEPLDTTVIKCALLCIETYIQKHTDCKVDEYECICKRKEVKDTDTVKCVIDACGFTRAKNKVYPVVKTFCKGV